jgi:hypothetical protein
MQSPICLIAWDLASSALKRTPRRSFMWGFCIESLSKLSSILQTGFLSVNKNPITRSGSRFQRDMNECGTRCSLVCSGRCVRHQVQLCCLSMGFILHARIASS